MSHGGKNKRKRGREETSKAEIEIGDWRSSAAGLDVSACLNEIICNYFMPPSPPKKCCFDEDKTRTGED